MKVMGIDAHFVIYGGETIGFTDTIGNERSIVDTAWHVTFIAGK